MPPHPQARLVGLPVFSPPKIPSVGSSYALRRLVSATQTQKGYDRVSPKSIRSLRRMSLIWSLVDEADRDYIESFFESLENGQGPFVWTPFELYKNPTGATPTLSVVAGGALAARTYYVGFTWRDSVYGETTISQVASIAVGSSEFLKVNVPPIPYAVEGFRVYASETLGDERLQATLVNTRAWTQSAALSGATATAPAENTLAPPAKWMLEGELEVTRPDGIHYAIQATLLEQQI